MKYTLNELKEMMKDSGGNLYLRGTQITALPEGLTVGGNLYLSGTQITALPEGLTVDGNLYLSGTQITNRTAYKRLENGDYSPNRYLYADGILTHIKSKKTFGKYTYYAGKIKGQNVISDGKNYAHCKRFKEGVADLQFKEAKERGAEQYKSLTPSSILTTEEAITAYRIITGACRAGTEQFLSTLGKLKDKYTVAEIIEITKGHYGNSTFSAFISNNE